MSGWGAVICVHPHVGVLYLLVWGCVGSVSLGVSGVLAKAVVHEGMRPLYICCLYIHIWRQLDKEDNPIGQDADICLTEGQHQTNKKESTFVYAQ